MAQGKIVFKPIVLRNTFVSPNDVTHSIMATTFAKMGNKITICHLTLNNGHEVIGYSGVVDPLKYDKKIGEDIAYEKAKDEVWKHLGALLQNQLANG